MAESAYAQPYRDEFPETCWRTLDEPGRVCILERGHDDAAHEPTAVADSPCPQCSGAPCEVQAECRVCNGYGRVLDAAQTVEKCWCCGTEHERRDPTSDPWEGRMDGYCEPCSWARCDAYPGECPVKAEARDASAATVDYAAMLAAQGGVCAICGRPPKTKRLHVDHDHRTGRIRGLLCFTCNHFILGKYATVAKLRAAADYLERGGVATTI